MPMKSEYKNIFALVAVLAICFLAYSVITVKLQPKPEARLDGTPYTVVLSGTYVCLPHLDTTGSQTEECAFGLKTDDGDYYAVNFGAATERIGQFQNSAHITAEGFVVIKEALSSDQWAKYNMKGVFTITRMIEVAQ